MSRPLIQILLQLLLLPTSTEVFGFYAYFCAFPASRLSYLLFEIFDTFFIRGFSGFRFLFLATSRFSDHVFLLCRTILTSFFSAISSREMRSALFGPDSKKRNSQIVCYLFYYILLASKLSMLSAENLSFIFTFWPFL